MRVRFAPSPTGYLHVGGLRTALYNFLFARKHEGVFILRIEDTDRTRLVDGAVENLIETLHWAGLTYDEGPITGGPHGPYIQSERLDIYRRHAAQLLQQGKAYYAFDTPEELDEMRKAREKKGLPPKYDRRALKLSTEEVQARLAAHVPFVIRLLVPDRQVVGFDDVIRGRVEFATEQIDDQVLLKSDGFPTYHLANVVDDHLMEVTHVIRGEEWLSSTPKHVLLYEYFGWELPRFAHLPLLLNPDKSKLSKRQGDVAVEDYRQKGYLKEALVNFVAFLGWNPGDEREVFELDELIAEFSLERVGKAGAVFNLEKLNWMNAQHLRRKTDAELLTMVKPLVHRFVPGAMPSDDYLLKVIGAMKERVVFVHEFVEKAPYFFKAPTQFDPAVVEKRWKATTPEHLRKLRDEFSVLRDPRQEHYENALKTVAAALNITPAEIVHPLRLAVSGAGVGPGLYDILFIIGKDETIRRINYALEHIQ